jgi:UDP-N-acetylmuramate--alanine ligase
VREGHAPDHIGADVECVIATTAVPPDAPELARARAAGVPVFRRGRVLAELLAGRRSVAVCGSHGKTTTTTFIAQLLRGAGLSPSFCIGGESDALGGTASDDGGAEGVMVVEADESDGTLAFYRPFITVVTNVEFDHAEHFPGMDALAECFRRAIANTARRVIYCADDPQARALGGESARGFPYGLGENARVRAVAIEEAASSTGYTMVVDGTEMGRIHLPVPGRHNVLNSLAAACVGFELGLEFGEVQRGLAGVSLPRRRFDRVVESGGITVISDYAHHPTEIAALVRAARGVGPARLLAVYQPHRYSRTLALGPEFPAAFKGVDDLVLVPVYAASEPPRKGGQIWDLYAHFRGGAAGGEKAPALPVPKLARSLEAAWAYLRRPLRAGDMLLVIGAGDVEKIAVWAQAELGSRNAERGTANEEQGSPADMTGLEDDLSLRVPRSEFRVRMDEPLATKTTLKVGGAADAFVEAGSEAALAELLRWTHERSIPFTILGAGSNVVVSDLGLRGLAARLGTPGFTATHEKAGEVVAGAGVPLARLMKWLEQLGWSGLEFLEGIPGTLGGALRMNAGAWGRELGEFLVWVRCLNRDGSACVLQADELGLGYRRCDALRERVAVEAGLKPARGKGSEIAKRRAEYAARREWMKGLRSAGSVFKNPAGDFAGRLIEGAGLKGRTVGAARMLERHANVLVAEEGATASDVLALIEIVRAEVAEKSGVALETEVEILG